jgi:hypothetical protein
MKQFLSTIVILLTLIFPTVSWGSVDGKGVICGEKKEEEYGTFYPHYFIFNKGKVREKYLYSEGDFIKSYEYKKFTYETTSTEIKWDDLIYGGKVFYSLNRKDLSLTKKFPTKSTTDKCTVFSEKEIIEEVDRLINVYLSELYEIMGGLDGKGIVCGEKIDDYPSFYFFKDGKVQKTDFKSINDKIITEKVGSSSYRTHTNNVVFSFNGRYELNRKELIIKFKDKSIDGGHQQYQQCKVYSEKELMREVNKLIGVLQSELDNSLKDNKI